MYFYIQSGISTGNIVGVSLKLHGVTIPNNSLVDYGDLLYRVARGTGGEHPTIANGLHDQTLLCVTDLVDCCESPHTVRGDWYYPDGRIVLSNTGNFSRAFLSNRGPHVYNDSLNQQFYGSVRLFRRYSPPERGRFHCELPTKDDPGVNQTVYVNICELFMKCYSDLHPIILYYCFIVQWTSEQWPSLPPVLAPLGETLLLCAQQVLQENLTHLVRNSSGSLVQTIPQFPLV